MEKVPLVQKITDNQGRKTVAVSQNTAFTLTIGMLITIVTLVASIVNSADMVTSRVSALERSDDAQSKEITALEADNVNSKVQLSEIQTQLKSIDANILEIKQTVRGSDK